MKQIMYSVVLGIIALIVFVGVISVQTKVHKEKEIDESLNVAIDSTIDELSQSQILSYSTDAEYLAAFEQLLLSKLSVSGDGKADVTADPNFKVTVSVAETNSKKGLLAIKVVENFSYPNNKIGEIEETAVILREVEKDKSVYGVKYQNSFDTISAVSEKYNINIPATVKEYELTEGSRLAVPLNQIKAIDKNGSENNIYIEKWKVVSCKDGSLKEGAIYTSDELRALVVGKDFTSDVIFESIIPLGWEKTKIRASALIFLLKMAKIKFS